MIGKLVCIHLAGMTWSAIRGWPSRAYRVRNRSLRRDIAEELLNTSFWPVELALDALIAWDGAVARIRAALRKPRR